MAEAELKERSVGTERLVLRPYEHRDVGDLHRVMANPLVMQHIGKGVMTRSDVVELVSRTVRSWEEIRMGWWTVRL